MALFGEPGRGRGTSVAAVIETSDSSEMCAECERAAGMLLSLAGARLCAECVEAYYVACAQCRALLPRDESLMREQRAFCAACFAGPAKASPDEDTTQALIAEYVALQAEEKKLSKRLEEIKEQLKSAASAVRREGGAVTLRAGEAGAVRCSYRTNVKLDPEALPLLEQLLDEEELAELFERKVSVTPNKERVAEFLAGADAAHTEARDVLRGALHETEIVTLSVVPGGKR